MSGDDRERALVDFALVAIYSRPMQSLLSPHGVHTEDDVDAVLVRVFGHGVRPLRFEAALFDAMLAGWRSQQAARYLKGEDDPRERGGGAAVRRACGVLAVGVAGVAR